jgi:hypothetical protein
MELAALFQPQAVCLMVLLLPQAMSLMVSLLVKVLVLLKVAVHVSAETRSNDRLSVITEQLGSERQSSTCTQHQMIQIVEMRFGDIQNKHDFHLNAESIA